MEIQNIENEKQNKNKKCSDLKEYHKQYYIKKHKEELLTKIICPLCHKNIYCGNMPRHKKSLKHIKLLNELNMLKNE